MVTIARLSTPTTGLVYQSDKVQLKIGTKLIDTGTLYITNESLAFQPSINVDGIAISWREISVQGISSVPTKCIYFMLDQKLCWRGVYEEAEANGHNEVEDAEDNNDDDDEGNVSDEGTEMTECWLIPEDPNTVEVIFQSMNECQALHPDDSISEESDSMDNDEDFEDDFDPIAGRMMNNLNIN